MDHFKINRHHPASIYQKVLRTPVAVGQADAAGRRFRNEPAGVLPEVGMPAGGRPIVRVDSQLIEDSLVSEFALPIGLPPAGAHHAGEQLTYSLRSSHADVTLEQEILPAGRIGGRGAHSESEVLPIFEQDFGKG